MCTFEFALDIVLLTWALENQTNTAKTLVLTLLPDYDHKGKLYCTLLHCSSVVTQLK